MLQSPWSLAAVCLHHKCSLSLSKKNPNESLLVKLAGGHVAVWILWQGVLPLLFTSLYFLVMHTLAPNHNVCFTSQVFQTVTAFQAHQVCSLNPLCHPDLGRVRCFGSFFCSCMYIVWDLAASLSCQTALQTCTVLRLQCTLRCSQLCDSAFCLCVAKVMSRVSGTILFRGEH